MTYFFRSSPTTYCGSIAWATFHKLKLQSEVGVTDASTGATVTRVAVEPYPGGGFQGTPFGVVKYWQYKDKPELGEFVSGFELLPKDMK